MTFKVLTAEFLHETNTFSVRKTSLAAFKMHRYMIGSDQLEATYGTNTGVAGCLECRDAHGWTMTHVVSAEAEPSGLVIKQAYDTIADMIVDTAQSHTFDGILLPLHGAMVTEETEDGEGELLQRLRDVVGSEIPIAITLDLHANATVKMCRLADIIVSYKTYPHIDMRETARHAGNILHRTMMGEITPTTLRVHRPMLCEANGGRTDIGPMIDRIKLARAYENEPDVFAVSINGGFESSDIAEVGPTVLVTYQGDNTRHYEFAETIADDIWERRADVLNSFYSAEQAAEIAAGYALAGGPLIIADYADNPGAGGYGDATALLKALLDAGVDKACFGAIVDAEAARYLHKYKEGDDVTLSVGGKTDPRFGGGPLTLTGQIMRLSDGDYVGDGPMMGGQKMNFGKTAVLNASGIDVLVVSNPAQILDQQQFRAFGIDPTTKTVVALKSMQHFRAAFESIAGKVIVCDSGALCTIDFLRLPYKKVPRPIYPLDPEMEL